MKTESPNIMEFSPSFFWLVLMILPLMYQIIPFGGIESSQIQLFSVFFTLFILASSDFFIFKQKSKQSNSSSRFTKYNIAVVASILILSIALLNLFLMPRIPLLMIFNINHASLYEVSMARMNANFSIGYFSGVAYLSNWIFSIFSPLAIIIFISLKKWLETLFLGLWLLFYGFSTTAILPLVLTSFTVVFSWCYLRDYFPKIVSKYILLIVVFFVFIFYIANSELLKYEKVEPSIVAQYSDPRMIDTVADRFRYDNKMGLTKYLLYRIWLTPADVSIRWYQFFTKNNPQLGLVSIFDRRVSPSNIVGKWIYNSKFPKKYLPYIHAYASFDADAYARGGILFVCFTTLLLGWFRISIQHLKKIPEFGCELYAIGLSALCILPFQSSLQAFFIAHGIILLFAISFFLIVKWK